MPSFHGMTLLGASNDVHTLVHEARIDDIETFQGITDGAPERIRTPDLCLRRATLYPAELRAPMKSLKLAKRQTYL